MCGYTPTCGPVLASGMTASAFNSYVICTSPRSGSTLLCRLLMATNAAGSPDSHFHVPSLDRWLEVYGLTDRTFKSRKEALRAVFDAARDRGAAGTVMFGLRMQRGSFDAFTKALAVLHPRQPSDIARIETEFGPTLFMHLTRADKLDQAISRIRAEQTGLWHRHADGTELERLAPSAPPRYDQATISAHLDGLTTLDDAWTKWFAREGVEPLRITYGALANHPMGTLARVLSALGLDPTVATPVEVPTAKLADAISREWRERFMATQAEDRNIS